MTTRGAQLAASLPPSQRETLQKVANLAGLSVEAACALQLCRETLRDYCPDNEALKVVALLVRLQMDGKT